MNKTDVINIINKISDECSNAGNCTKCAFYNVVDHVEGCIFDELVQQYTPGYFKDVLKKNS